MKISRSTDKKINIIHNYNILFFFLFAVCRGEAGQLSLRCTATFVTAYCNQSPYVCVNLFLFYVITKLFSSILLLNSGHFPPYTIIPTYTIIVPYTIIKFWSFSTLYNYSDLYYYLGYASSNVYLTKRSIQSFTVRNVVIFT